jgi:hypothetical protein
MKREIFPRLDSGDKALMEKIPASGSITHKFAVRIQTVLHRANGKTAKDTACFLGIHPMAVSGYVKRYNSGGIEALFGARQGNRERPL